MNFFSFLGFILFFLTCFFFNLLMKAKIPFKWSTTIWVLFRGDWGWTFHVTMTKHPSQNVTSFNLSMLTKTWFIMVSDCKTWRSRFTLTCQKRYSFSKMIKSFLGTYTWGRREVNTSEKFEAKNRKNMKANSVGKLCYSAPSLTL